MANSVQRLMDEGQLMKPCTSFYTGSQAFKFSNPLWLCFSPPFLKVGSTSKLFNSKMWSSRKRNPTAVLILTACKGHTESPPGTVSTLSPRTQLSKFRLAHADRFPCWQTGCQGKGTGFLANSIH